MFGIKGLLCLAEYLTPAEEIRLTKLLNKKKWDNSLKR